MGDTIHTENHTEMATTTFDMPQGEPSIQRHHHGRGRDHLNDTACALETFTQIDTIRITKFADNPDRPTTDHDIDKELRAMRRAAHDHCVKLIEVFETLDEVQVVLEYMQGGDLFSRILEQNSRGVGMPEEEVKAMMRQTITGV